MTRRIVQHAIIKVVQPQIVEYTCDECGKVCGTRANPKETWTGMGREAGRESHYCKKTCGPHAVPRREAILGALAFDHTRRLSR